MKGAIRVPKKYSYCPNLECESEFIEIGGKDGYICPKGCGTTPKRFYLDVHFKGQRFRIFCDGQGKPLDTYDRAFSLLARINYDIEHYTFDPSKYVKAEQESFYCSTLLDQYLEYKLNSLAPSYHINFKRHIRLAKGFFNTKDVREIRKFDLIIYQRHLQQSFPKISNKTIKNIMDTFKAFLNYLKNDLEVITSVPKFPDIDIDLKPFKWLSQDDQIKLFELVPDKHKPIFAFLMLHGCRPSEARALKCKDVDLQNLVITISSTFSGSVYREKRKGKNSRSVTIPLHPELYDYIAHRVKNNLSEAFVFVNPNTGRPYDRHALYRVWDFVREKAGIDKSLRLYDATRHSFASNLVNGGATIYKVSKLLGHSSVKMTEKYTHSLVENLRTDIQRLSLKPSSTVIQGGFRLKKSFKIK